MNTIKIVYTKIKVNACPECGGIPKKTVKRFRPSGLYCSRCRTVYVQKGSHFKKGSGCFECADCGKMTRDVDGNGDVGLCQQCYNNNLDENTRADHMVTS